ncbi:MAG TPA: hypothetical protein VN476_18950 [Pyrinomonadaceae bacterium]|nr:hypothetical protein [Pyrinomonadaceae bacterium]
MVNSQRSIRRVINILILLSAMPPAANAQTATSTDSNRPDIKILVDGPVRLAVDVADNLYVSDKNRNAVFRIGADGTRRIVAGTGSRGATGDGGQATNAELNQPAGLAVDSSGQLFIADEGNERVRKVSVDGRISTVAGKGVAGFSGDGGRAIAAQLSSPSGVAVDGAGNLFIADRWNNRIRKVTPHGKIMTVAGNGQNGNKGDGQLAVSAELRKPVDVAVDEAGKLFIADYGNDRVRRVNSDGNIATVARVSYPTALTVDRDGTLFVIDSANDCIFKIAEGNFSTLVCARADNDRPSLRSSGKNGIAVDRAHNLYVADNSTKTITKMGQSGAVTTVFTGGKAGVELALTTLLNQPAAVAADAAGNIYIAERGGNLVRKVSPSGTIAEFAGTGLPGYSGDGGPATRFRLWKPEGLTVNALGELFIADTGNNLIRKVDAAGVITTIAGSGGGGGFSGDGGPAIRAELHSPMALAFDLRGNLYFADTFNHRIRKIDGRGIITTVAGNGADKSQEGNVGDGGPAVKASLQFPRGVAVDTDGNVIIADTGNGRIRKVNQNGTISTLFGKNFGAADKNVDTSLRDPVAVAIDRQGNIFVADRLNRQVIKTDRRGGLSVVAGAQPADSSKKGAATEPAISNDLQSVALDNQGNVLFVQTDFSVLGTPLGRQLVQRIDSKGKIITIAGNAFSSNFEINNALEDNKLKDPLGIAMDAEGRLFIADTGNHRLVKLNPDGTLDVLAGTGTSGSPVNGGKARSATLHKPEGVAVDAQGNLFVSDAENRVVQKINGLGIISIVVGNGQFGYSGDGGPAVRATLATPHDLKIDRGGNLIIADWGIGPHRQRLRRVSPDGIISSILPEGADALKIVQPQCLALDNLGNILVGDGDTDRVWKIHPDGTVTLVAGAEHSDRSQKDYYAAPAPGTPLNTTLNDPRGVAADTHGNIFISDSANHRVLKVDLNGLIRVVAGNGKKTYQGEGYYSGDGGPAVKASLSFPAGLLVDTKGNLFIVDSGNNRVRKVNAEGVIMTVAGY